MFLISATGGLKISSLLRTLPFAFAFLLAASLYLGLNFLLTGNPFTTALKYTWGGTGFGLGAVNWGPPHTFGYGLVNTFMSLAGLNVFLYEIPLPALSGILLWGLFGKKMNRWDKTFLAAIILVPVGYLLYYFHDFCFGPRYYYVIVPQLLYFSIKGARALYGPLVEHVNVDARAARTGLITAGILLIFFQISLATPHRASVYADAYWGTDDGPMKEARCLGLKNAIVFIENHPWEILMTKLHSLGFIMGDAHRFLFLITPEGLDQVLIEMRIKPEEAWGLEVDRHELEKRIYDWNRAYREAGNPPVDPWAEKGEYSYFSNGALYLDPTNRQPGVILARDLGKHNLKLLQKFPDRKGYRYSYDREARRFRVLPVGGEGGN